MPEAQELPTSITRTVLFIAYHYPPMRSTGIERTVKHVRYLPEFGYRPQILTTSAFSTSDRQLHNDRELGVVRAWEPLAGYRWLMDGAVRRDKEGSISVRTDAGAARGLVSLLRRWVMIPDGQITWLPAAAAAGLRALRAQPADLLYSTYPPGSAHLLGLLMKWLTGLPWVADFRDSWVGDPLDPEAFDVPGRRRLESRMERAVVTHADWIIAATDISADMLREAYPQEAARIGVITNGFDPADLQDVSTDEDSTAGVGEVAERLDIVHAGSFSTSHPRRSPLSLFAALQSLIAESSDWTQRLRVILAGHLTVAEQDAAAALSQAGIVDIRGELTRPASLALQRCAGALLLVDHRRPGLSSNVPGKLYEYLAAGRPVLALCGDGMVARLLDDMQAGMRADPDDPAAIRQLLVDAHELHSRGALRSAVTAERLRPFHRRELARQLACCFDEVVTAGSARPTVPLR